MATVSYVDTLTAAAQQAGASVTAQTGVQQVGVEQVVQPVSHAGTTVAIHVVGQAVVQAGAQATAQAGVQQVGAIGAAAQQVEAVAIGSQQVVTGAQHRRRRPRA